jgi:hypothetical protein
LAQIPQYCLDTMGILYMTFGALLVATGVLASALADRIRGLCVQRQTPTPTPRVEPQRLKPRPAAVPAVFTNPDGFVEVTAVLVAAGYKKVLATQATQNCSAAERASLETWTRAALRRCVNPS